MSDGTPLDSAPCPLPHLNASPRFRPIKTAKCPRFPALGGSDPFFSAHAAIPVVVVSACFSR